MVASLGTALTEAQGRLLRRSCQKVIIGYDADGAGQTAILRGLEILQDLGCDMRILQLDAQAKDPDEYVIKYGPDRFLRCMDKAISLVEFKVKMLKNDLDLNNVNDKIKFLNEVAKILSRVDNRMEKEIYIEKISNEYKVSKEAIYAEINKLLYKRENPGKKLEKVPVVSVKNVQEKNEVVDEKTKRKESLLIYLLVNYPDKSYKKLAEIIKGNFIKITTNKEIVNKLYEEYEKGNINIDNILDWFNDENTINYLSGIMSTDFEITDVDKCIDDIIITYQKEALIEKRNSIIKSLENTENLMQEEITNLEGELNNIIMQLAKIK